MSTAPCCGRHTRAGTRLRSAAHATAQRPRLSPHRSAPAAATEGPWPKIDPHAALNEIARVVKPGGVLLLVDHPRDQITYKGPMVGKTDRFVMVLRKQR